VGKSLETALQRVELAERLGYESAFLTHIAGRDSVTTLMAYAARSSRLTLGTGVMPIYSRTPVATAQSFATLDEFSGGRAVCGLGVSHRPVVESWYGQQIGKPLRETREYVGILRAIFAGENPPQGDRFASAFHFMGYSARPISPSTWPASPRACCAWRAKLPTASCSGSATRPTSARRWCPR
jgi:alkanesulfonate monooxygenase SsuD/methylene tetrahydromethanopterin reductase-like flavin-dependent oxidoreductase (luciferase family)